MRINFKLTNSTSTSPIPWLLFAAAYAFMREPGAAMGCIVMAKLCFVERRS